jgi:hypothetical protein
VCRPTQKSAFITTTTLNGDLEFLFPHYRIQFATKSTTENSNNQYRFTYHNRKKTTLPFPVYNNTVFVCYLLVPIREQFCLRTKIMVTSCTAWTVLLVLGQLTSFGTASQIFHTRRNLVTDNETTNATLGNEKATLSDGGAFSETGVSFRQSFCDRYEEMMNTTGNEEISVRDALSGAQLNVLLISGSYLNYSEETGIDPVHPGINANILDYIAENANLTWRDSFGLWTSEERGNRSITEFLQWSTNKYDVVVGTWTASTDRMNLGISFINPHFDGSLIMVRDVAPPKSQVDLFNWLSPFKYEVWFVIVVIVIFSSVVNLFIEHIGKQCHEDLSFRKWLMDNLYLSFLNITANYSYEPQTLGGRVFGVSFAFWAMLITAAYTANLASLLVSKTVPTLRVNDIQEAIDLNMKICVHATSYSETYMKDNYPFSTPLLVLRANQDDMYDSLLNKECDILLAYKQSFETYKLRDDTNPDCTLAWEGRVVKNLKDGFSSKLDPAVKCTDLVNEVFNYYITEIVDIGFLDQQWSQHTQKVATPGHCAALDNNMKSESTNSANRRHLKATGDEAAAAATTGASTNESNSLSLKAMAGTMIFQVIGSGIAILVALLSRFERNKNLKRHTSTMKNFNKNNSTNTSEGQIDVQAQLDDLQSTQKELAQQMNMVISMLENMQGNEHVKGNKDTLGLKYTPKSITRGSFNTYETEGSLGCLPYP